MQSDEFEQITDSILSHPLFLETRQFEHHGDGNSVYDHSLATARVAYAIAKALDLNDNEVRSATRAALLHDFFGYDWHSDWFKQFQSRYSGLRRIGHMHAFVHGNIAAIRAHRYFGLTSAECDAIASHMFPIALKMPRTRIAWIVSLADKLVASREMTAAIRSYAVRFCHKVLA